LAALIKRNIIFENDSNYHNATVKVAYLNCLLARKDMLGVEKKLAAQAKAVALLGLDMDVFYFNFDRQLKESMVRFHRRAQGSAEAFLAALWRYGGLSRVVGIDRYDLFLLRYSRADFSLFAPFFRDHAGRVVTEHHTKELPEAHTYNTTLPQKALTLLMEKVLGPRFIRQCAGLIGVTDEIKTYELNRCRYPIPSCTIPNGTLVGDIPFSRHAPYRGDVLNLLCLANHFETWQGLDRVLLGLQDYVCKKPMIHLTVVGHISRPPSALLRQLQHNKRVRVDLPGTLQGGALEDVLKESHVAFSSLALFRKGMKEACALKTREFAARGLPFVLGYADPDFDQEAGEFFLRVSADDSPVNMDQVVAFAERVLRSKGVSESMRRFSEDRLDWKVKMAQVWDFLKTVAQPENNPTDSAEHLIIR
jgi:hypothetical protein